MFYKKKIKQELSDLLSTKNVSILRQGNCENLAKFRIDNLNLQIPLKSITFYEIVSEMVKDSPVGISVASAIFCHFRNKHMSLLHHIVSQILDKGVATDEVSPLK